MTSLVLMDCHVTESARLEGCELVEVLNPDYGFGFAALKMAERGWMTAGAPPEGAAPVDGIWRFRVEFGRRRKP